MSKPGLVNTVARVLSGAGITSGERLVVAVSGGVDSMVLLDVLACLRDRLGLRLHVAHVHHGLRGRAADRDAALVVAEAARRGLGISLARVDPAERPRGESVEAWARSARYRCLEAVRREARASRILIAHTQGDQAETLLLNLLRGTGPRGLAGIPPVRDRILRPLLSVSRAAVEAYAAARGVAFREDASNASGAYRRNRVRHRLLPLLARDYNPRIVESLASLAGLMREDEAALTALAASLVAAGVRKAGPVVYLDLATFQSAPPAVTRRALHEAVRMARPGFHSLTRRHLEALGRLLARDAVVRLPGGLLARRAGDAVRIETATAPSRAPEDGRRPPAGPPEIPVRLGKWTPWAPLGCVLRARRLTGDFVRPAGRVRWREVLSPKVLEAPLSLRGWRPGDRFQPLGLTGVKKLQDFFVDAKVPRSQRRWIPLLFTGDRIAWVVGHRIAEDFRWRGGGPACVVEVRFPEDTDGLPVGTDPDQHPGDPDARSGAGAGHLGGLRRS